MLSKQLKEKLNEYFQKKLGMYSYSKGWLKGNCPSCGEHKFGINLSSDRSNCFKCKFNPRPKELVMQLEKFDTYIEFNKLMANLEGITFYEEELERMEIREVLLPEGYRNIRLGNSVLAKSCRNYWKKRGFNLTELSMAGFGYCSIDKYFGYTIIPYYENNKLVYFTTRLFLGSGPKFNNPKAEDFGIGKSSLVYNRDALNIYDRIFLVESVTNARTLGDDAIAIGGKALSKKQLNYIIKSPCKKIVIGLDRDAIQYAIEIAFKLIDYKKVKIMIMPKEKDINDLGKKESLTISHQSQYMNYQSLQKFKHKFLDEHKT